MFLAVLLALCRIVIFEISILQSEIQFIQKRIRATCDFFWSSEFKVRIMGRIPVG